MATSIRWMTAGIALVATIGLVGIACLPSAHADGPRLFGRGGFRNFPGWWPPAAVPEVVPDAKVPENILAPKLALKPPAPIVPLKPSPPIVRLPFAVNKDMPINVKNIATLLKDGRPAAARHLAVTVAKTEIEYFSDLDYLYRPRNKNGMGWGSTPLKIPYQDGLELVLRNLVGPMPVKLVASQANDVEAAYWLEAMAELTLAAKPPVMTYKNAKATKQRWIEGAEQLRIESIQFREAVIGMEPSDMRAAAARINAVCNGCHAIFKE